MKAAIYTRVSSKPQTEKYSLPAQEDALKKCISREVHQDYRPILQYMRMLLLVEKKGGEGITATLP